MPVDKIILFLNFLICLRNGKLVISPDGILIKSSLNFLNRLKLSIQKGDDKNLIFSFFAMIN